MNEYFVNYSGTFDVYLEYCTCNSKDGCNEASSLAPRLMSILLAAAFACLLLR